MKLSRLFKTNLMTDFPKLRIIHAPHEPDHNYIRNIKDTYSKFGHDSIILEDLESIESSKENIIIVGEVGFLSKLYWLSIITYIGGGFSSGIHNIMEPAVGQNLEHNNIQNKHSMIGWQII